MTEDELLEKYFEMYYYELEHRETINNGLGIAVAVVVALGGGLLFYFREGPKFNGSGWHWVYYILLAVSAMCLAVAIYHFGRSWFGRRYYYITPPNEIEAWRIGEKAYHDAHPDERPSLPERTRNALIAQVADVATENRTSNRIKSEFAFLGRAWTLAAVALMLLGFVPYSVLSQKKIALAPPVRATSLTEEPRMSNEQKRQGSGESEPAPVSSPEKQPFPKPESFREGNWNIERKSDSDSGRDNPSQ